MQVVNQTIYLHKDTISNGRCVVPLRKEWGKFDSLISLSSTQMSSQQIFYMVRRHGCALEMMAVRNVDYTT
jgi:hypothetical protein